VTDLQFLRPLNRDPYHVKVPEALKYTPVVQTDFKDTLTKARSANFKAWAKALGLPVGASTNVGGSKDMERTVSCKSIVTTVSNIKSQFILFRASSTRRKSCFGLISESGAPHTPRNPCMFRFEEETTHS
jgi:hypothetical protein